MPQKIDNALIGAAGVHWVVSELSLRNLIALPTIRNAPGIDVVAVDLTFSWHANLQVKTSKSEVKFWPVSRKYRDFRGPDNFYVFVRKVKKDSRFEAFLIPADKAIEQITRASEEARNRGCKDWAPCWPLPTDDKSIQELRDSWRTFGPWGER